MSINLASGLLLRAPGMTPPAVFYGQNAFLGKLINLF